MVRLLKLVGSVLVSPGSETGPPGLHSIDLYVDFVWEKFGHNALRIVDSTTGSDISWEWGVFDFDQDDFYLRLGKGTMLYSMGAWSSRAARFAVQTRAAGSSSRQ